MKSFFVCSWCGQTIDCNKAQEHFSSNLMEPFEIIKIAHSSMPKEITLGNLKESDKTCVSVNFILGNEE